MSKKFFGAVSLLSLSTLIISGALAVAHNSGFEKAEAYSTSSLPTTIKLKDTDEDVIRNYYSSLDDITDVNQRKGKNLLKNLKTILKNGQKYYSYDSGNAIWQIYEIADRDWVRSPASSTTYGTYNSSTQTITGYTYGTSASSSKNNPYIHALYINRNVTNQTTAWDDHNQDEWGINREHVWPKSQGFETSGNGGARGDPMHLMAGNGYSNNIHSNYFYGYVNPSGATDCGTKYSNQYGNLRGTSLTIGSGTVFEPQDCDKGDIARAIFYMAARYNYLSGSDSDGINSDNPNLEIVQSSAYASSGYSSTTSTTGKMGILTDLLAWHHADPVDDYEKHRNNLLYENYTNNRNPFIDFPEWVDYIWGTAEYSGKTFESYDSTPTGYASPSSDTLYGYNEAVLTPIVNSVTVTPSSLSLDLNGTKTRTLSASVSVENGAEQTVTWHSSNTSVASVTNAGFVTGVGVGTTIITATSTADDTKYGTCVVTVSDSSSQGGEEVYYDATMNKGSRSSNVTVNGISGIKVGTGDYGGDMSITVPAGSTSLRFYAAAWKGVTGLSLNLSGATTSPSSVALTADTGVQQSSPFTLSSSESNYLFEIDLINITQETTITLTTSIDKRFVIWGAQYSTGSAQEVTASSITASVSKSFKVGETITKSDITLTNDLDETITDFEFEDYQFTYEDAESGGIETEKDFEISYDGLETSFNVFVTRNDYIKPDDIIVNYNDFSTGLTGSSSSPAINTLTVDGYSIKATNSYRFGSNPYYLALKSYKGTSKFKTDGIIYNETKFPTPLKTEVDYELYDNNVDATILYSTDGKNWSSTLSGDCYYFKLSFDQEFSGYIDFTSITITLKHYSLPDFIMYEDNVGQCNSKLDVALDVFETLTTSQRNTFMTSDNYVITTARERLEAWCRNQGKTITYVNGDYVVNGTNARFNYLIKSNNVWMIVLISISVTSLSGIAIYLVSKKKRKMH